MSFIESIKTGTLIGKYLTGNESSSEYRELKDWLREHQEHKILFSKIKDQSMLASMIRKLDLYNRDQAWKRYRERIEYLALRKTLVSWKVAAVFFFLIGCGGILAYLKTDFHPAATFSSASLYTTVATERGEHSKVILPDSSVVWLNSETTLFYNHDFAVKNRDIKLSGQAFFEIARNKKIPLFVHVNGLKVKVLGTKFDVSTYPNDKQIDVVLACGSVNLLNDHDRSFNYLLKPGEKACFNVRTKAVSISPVNVYKYTSWKDGVLIFDNTPMEEVLEKLERWYNIQIEVKDPKIYLLVFNATIINENVNDIFDLIHYTCGVNYQIIPSKDPEIPVKVILKSL